MTPTATGTRIRWCDEPETGDAKGMIGALKPVMFRIDAVQGAAQWLLTTMLPDMERRGFYYGDVATLKDQAEYWLEEFVSALGAVFPETRDGERRCPRDHKRWGRGLAMDRVPGGGWSCPGILADGRACGLELDPAGKEQQR